MSGHLWRRERFVAFDGLRAVAIVLVFLTHASAGSFFAGGSIGVDLFFVLSGYLITSLLVAEHARTGGIHLGRFYARRALRLAPALVLLAIPVTQLMLANDYGQLKDTIAALTYTTDLWEPHASLLKHTWSLSVEEQFYLTWPLILVVALSRGWPLRRLLVGAALAGLLATPLWPFPAGIAFAPVAHVPELCCGALMAVIMRTDPGRALLGKLAGPAVMAVAAVAVLVVARPSGWLPPFEGWWIYGVLAILCSIPVAHLATHPEGAWARTLSHPPLVWLGARSYGFYLWHYPILRLLQKNVAASHTVTAVEGLVIALVVTELSWRYVERPFLRLKSRLEAPVGTAAPEAAAA